MQEYASFHLLVFSHVLVSAKTRILAYYMQCAVEICHKLLQDNGSRCLKVWHTYSANKMREYGFSLAPYSPTFSIYGRIYLYPYVLDSANS